MKSFSKFLKEGIGTSDQSRATDNGINPSEIQNPRVLRALNAYVGAIANMEYIMPEHALHRLRGSLNKIGLSFGAYPEMVDESGSFDLPLSLFGGRFGKDENTPADEFLDDDGISNMVEGGLTLKVRYEMINNNSCKVFAKVE